MTTAPAGNGGRDRQSYPRADSLRVLIGADTPTALVELAARVEAASTVLAAAVVSEDIDLTDAALGALALLERARLFLRLAGVVEGRDDV
jgi:hypothetical protein